MEHFINILIVDESQKNQRGLKEILNGNGNNVIIANSTFEAFNILHQREVGILILNIDKSSFKPYELLKEINNKNDFANLYKIVLTENTNQSNHVLKAINEGAIDYITFPLNPNLVRAKIDILKSLYYKDQRIGQLLANIFPESVLQDFNNFGKFSPKRIENGVVLFTDFVGFSQKAKSISPMKLLKKLESYFTKFDEITNRYRLEKIKTIGDSYMAIAGVTEDLKHPEIRACLAAIEMRNYLINEKILAQAVKKDFWEIRIGIHSGPLVAGIIGTKKFNFDVWGDTVNIAARAEEAAEKESILVSSTVKNQVEHFFDLSAAENMEIKKRGGKIEMFNLERLKLEHCLYGEGKIANIDLLKKCELPTIDFDHMKKDILNRLKSMLNEDLYYHDLNHTLNVEKAAIRYAKLEGLSEYETKLLCTAVYFHDAGFLVQYHDNEDYAIKMAINLLPYYGYEEHDIEIICKIIEATKSNIKPKTLIEKIMCDSDHDYIGRADYYHIAAKLKMELEFQEIIMDEEKWINFQLEFLKNKHVFYTETAKNIRQSGKNARIAELEFKLQQLTNNA